MDINRFRKEIRDWFDKELGEIKVYNASMGDYILIRRSGIKHAVGFSNAHYVEKLKSVKDIVELITKAVFVRTEPDKRERKAIKAIHKLQTHHEIEGIVYKIEISIESGIFRYY